MYIIIIIIYKFPLIFTFKIAYIFFTNLSLRRVRSADSSIPFLKRQYLSLNRSYKYNINAYNSCRYAGGRWWAGWGWCWRQSRSARGAGQLGQVYTMYNKKNICALKGYFRRKNVLVLYQSTFNKKYHVKMCVHHTMYMFPI